MYIILKTRYKLDSMSYFGKERRLFSHASFQFNTNVVNVYKKSSLLYTPQKKNYLYCFTKTVPKVWLSGTQLNLFPYIMFPYLLFV